MGQVLTAIRMLVAMTILTGVVYPLLVTALAQGLFPRTASGGLAFRANVAAPVGASLLAQKFESPPYFWPRPSAVDYNAGSSGGSNLSQGSADLKKAYEERLAKLRAAHPSQTTAPPAELLFASGSGLDPHISPEAAEYQLIRVAEARKLTPEALRKFVRAHVEGRQLGFLGEPRVNVLELNMALDAGAH